MNRRSTRRRFQCAVVGVLAAHAALVGWIACRISPTCDEVGHLPAGLYIWEFGHFDVYRVNPPLVRAIAALPVVWSRAKLSWNQYTTGPKARPEWALGEEFVSANDAGDIRWLNYFVMARWACIPFSLLAGYVVCRWSSELYGRAAGLLSLMLWCTCPNVLAWASTICPDVGAASLGVTASYLFWRWLRRPSWLRAFAAGLALGLAELSKTTWIVLYGVWPLLWFAWQWFAVGREARSKFNDTRPVSESGRPGRPGRPRRRPWMRGAAELAVMIPLSVYVVNLGYGFEGSLRRLGDYTFVSRVLTGEDAGSGNRFTGTWLGQLPLPWPENYVAGIDLQKADFEKGKDSHLLGEWKHGGWWYYYLFVAALKVPLGVWALGFLAMALTVSPRARFPAPGNTLPARRCAARYFAGWKNEITLLAPALVVFILVSSQTGFNRYFRYVLPAFPFAYIWMGKAAGGVALKHRSIAIATALALSWSVASGALVYPHSMSYFNELAGGPIGGHRYVIDANIDWGQDMLYLKEWLDLHPEAAPLKMAYFSFIHPHHFGIESTAPPQGPRPGVRYGAGDKKADQVGPQPGWYAMSIHRIHGKSERYLYFLDFEPVARAGYSIYIYHVSLDEANSARRNLGLPPLSWEASVR